MARITAYEMAQMLKAKGYKVSLVKRSEGSYRISKIDKVHYTGSQGNIAARRLLGVSLSEAQELHMKRIRQKKGVFGKPRKEPIDKELERLQKQANRAFKNIGQSARVTRAKIRWRLQNEGYKETLEYLRRVVNYAKGFAHEESIIGLIERLEADNKKIKSWDVEQVINALNNLITQHKKLQEPNFQELKDLIYEWEEKYNTPLAMADSTFRHRALMIINRAE